MCRNRIHVTLGHVCDQIDKNGSNGDQSSGERISNSKLFVFSNWSVHSRHPDALPFNNHNHPKTASFIFIIAVYFNFSWMWTELQDSSVRVKFTL